MIDAVYPLGRGSKQKNLELRYSLRSLEKHALDLQNVFIVGERPDWLSSEIIHIPCPDLSGNAARNIMHKVVTACQDERLSENFTLLNDDYFLTKPARLSEIPHYWKCDLEQTYTQNKTDYRKHVFATLKALQERGLPTKNFDVHYPTIFEKGKLLEVVRQYSWGSPFGLTLKSLYCNTLQIEGVHRQDCKEAHARTKDWWHGFAKDVEIFSIADPSITPAFKEFLAEAYPEKSRYEI